MKKLFAIIYLVVLFSSVTVFAHPGRLDKNSGHNVNTPGWGYPVGSYHYHIGSDRETAYDENGNIIPKTETPDSTPEPSKIGDVNGDGKIDAMDVLRLRQYLASWKVTIINVNSDCNGDSKIDAMDVLRLRQFLANWKVTLGK